MWCCAVSERSGVVASDVGCGVVLLVRDQVELQVMVDVVLCC